MKLFIMMKLLEPSEYKSANSIKISGTITLKLRLMEVISKAISNAQESVQDLTTRFLLMFLKMFLKGVAPNQ